MMIMEIYTSLYHFQSSTFADYMFPWQLFCGLYRSAKRAERYKRIEMYISNRG